MKGIRFLTMTYEEFAVVLDSKILTLDEVTNIIKHLGSVLTSPIGFPVSQSVGTGSCPRRCCRFGSVVFSGGWSNGISELIFSVNKNILFYGVYLFGSEGNDYTVSLTIKHLPDNYILASSKGTFSSIQHQSKNYWGFDALLDQPVSLGEGERYRIY